MKNIIEKRIWLVGKEEMGNYCDEFSNLDHYQHRLKRLFDWWMNFDRHDRSNGSNQELSVQFCGILGRYDLSE